MACEFTFSTRGRIIDEYRSFLTPQMVEALVCTFSWLKGLRKSSIFDSLLFEDFKEVEKLEGGMMFFHLYYTFTFN